MRFNADKETRMRPVIDNVRFAVRVLAAGAARGHTADHAYSKVRAAVHIVYVKVESMVDATRSHIRDQIARSR